MKRLLPFIVTTLVIGSFFVSGAQIPDYIGNCAGIPCIQYLPKSKLVPIGDNEILLGEGIISRDNSGSGNYSYWNSFEYRWPCNRPLWPIATAHAWAMFRSISGISNHDINSYSAILINETIMSCDDAIDFSCLSPSVQDPNQFGNPSIPLITDFSGYSPGGLAAEDGCFQIDGLGRAALYEGSSACGNCGFYDNKTETEEYITHDAYETAVIGRTFYDLIFLRKLEDVRGLDPVPTLNNTNDPYATLRLFSAAYNQGFNALFTKSDDIFGPSQPLALASNDWSEPSLLGFFGYSEACVHYNKVLNNDYTSTNSDDLQQWLDWYDNDISWILMNDYLTEIFPMFDLTAAEETAVRTRIQTVFDAQKDALGNVSFRYKLGPVIDELVLALPYTDPSYTNISSQDAVSTCHGCVGPYVTLETDYNQPVCSGNSVKIETIYGAGYAYTWIKDEVVIANSNTDQHIFYATQSGVYSVVVTDEKDCSIRSDVDIDVLFNSCSGCDLNMTLTETGNSCTDIGDGNITIVLSGTDYSTSKLYSYTLTNPDNSISSSNSPFFSNLIQGIYQLEVVEVGNPNCSAYGSIALVEDEIVYQSVVLSENTIRCDEVDLKADVVGNPPSTCDYNLRIESNQTAPCFGEVWTTSDYRLSINVNGVSIGDRTPTPVNGDCILFEEDFGVEDGDLIEVIVKNISCGGGSTNMNRHFILTDPNNNETSNFLGTLNSGLNVAVSTVATCEQPVINYDLTWSSNPDGNISNIATSNNTSSATGKGTSWVKIEATSTSNTCVLVDSIQIVDSCGGICTDPETVQLQHNNVNISNTISLCSNELSSNYDITTSITGTGTFEYELFKNNNSTGDVNNDGNFSINTAGEYYVKVTDATNPDDPLCQKNSNIIAVEEVSSPDTSNVSIVCNGSNLDVSFEIINGDQSSYLVNGSTNGISGSTYNTTIPEGNYTFVIKDQYECDSIIISGAKSCGCNSEVSYALSGDAIICEGDRSQMTISIVSGSGPFNFLFDHNGTNVPIDNIELNEFPYVVSNVVSGTYTLVKVSDLGTSGCENGEATISGDPVEITEHPELDTSNFNITCDGTNPQMTVTFDISGGDPASYSVNGNLVSSNSFSSGLIDEGTYQFVITDQYDCNPITIEGNKSCSCASEISLSGETSICDELTTPVSIDLIEGNGPFTISFDNNGTSETLSLENNQFPYQFDVSAGIYRIISASDAGTVGCESSGDVTITNTTLTIESLNVIDTNSVNVNCEPDNTVSVTFDIEGGNSTSYEVMKDGMLVGSGSNSFSISDLTENTDHTFTINDNSICNPFLFTINKTCSCPASVIDMTVTGQNELCGDQSDSTAVVVRFTSGFGPYSLTLSNGTDDFVKISDFAPSMTFYLDKPGTYEITNFTSNATGNCGTFTGIDPIVINQRVIPQVRLTSELTQQICANTNESGYLDIEIIGNENNAPFKVDYLHDGTVNSVDIAGLDDVIDGFLTEGIYTLVGVRDIYCEGTVGDPNEMNLTIGESLSPTLSLSDTVICESESVELQVNGVPREQVIHWIEAGQSINGTDKSLSYLFNASGISSGTEIHVLVDDAACSGSVSSDTAIIIVKEQPKVFAGDDQVANIGESVILNGAVSPESAKITWNPTTLMISGENTSSPTIEIPENAQEFTQIYQVIALLNGCSDEDNVTVTVSRDIQIFNSFSPNGDGVNDEWVMYGIEKYPNIKVSVFNRWGQVVFSSINGYNEKWDGRLNGNALPSGTYYYTIDLNNAEDKSMTGSVTIIR